MTTQPRLFARTLEQHNASKQLSSESFIIVLLDIDYDDTRLRQELSHLSNCHYFRANDTNNCLELINQEETKDALILVITSYQFVDFIRYTLLDIVPQLSHIYLFDDVLCNQELLFDSRFRGTSHNVQSLFKKMHRDIEEVRSPRCAAEGIQYVLKDNAKCFWYRFFFNVLDRLQHTDIAKREIFSPACASFQNSPSRLHSIDEFEHEYRPEHAIYWYTIAFPFCHVLNSALLSHDINEIFSWRVYIQDLNRQLQQLHSEQIDDGQLHLFRGQLLHIGELNRWRESVGQLITVAFFLSTTLNANIAKIFTGDKMSTNSSLQRVLFSITIDSNSVNTVYAALRHYSPFAVEEEYLFSLRSLFRITGVEFVDNLWQIDLTVVDEDDQEFCTAINPWKVTIGEQSFFSDRHEPLFTRYLNFENGSFLAF